MFKMHTTGANICVFVLCAVMALLFRASSNVDAAQMMLMFMTGWFGTELVKYFIGRK